ncbi:hypothetical protein BJ508DRAFT_310032 [Ascobolus immersus RN42]|uniref:Uncharacterized protein n=1 Tax=Ascobolus immersus RN42 TaxID=1160509 RepID=A0A3N4HUL5_ASCIM|nr:hypothetical protein BJ508DRAFT_310032 [Ascobolus immersus RN42]
MPNPARSAQQAIRRLRLMGLRIFVTGRLGVRERPLLLDLAIIRRNHDGGERLRNRVSKELLVVASESSRIIILGRAPLLLMRMSTSKRKDGQLASDGDALSSEVQVKESSSAKILAPRAKGTAELSKLSVTSSAGSGVTRHKRLLQPEQPMERYRHTKLVVLQTDATLKMAHASPTDVKMVLTLAVPSRLLLVQDPLAFPLTTPYCFARCACAGFEWQTRYPPTNYSKRSKSRRVMLSKALSKFRLFTRLLFQKLLKLWITFFQSSHSCLTGISARDEINETHHPRKQPGTKLRSSEEFRPLLQARYVRISKTDTSSPNRPHGKSSQTSSGWIAYERMGFGRRGRSRARELICEKRAEMKFPAPFMGEDGWVDCEEGCPCTDHPVQDDMAFAEGHQDAMEDHMEEPECLNDDHRFVGNEELDSKKERLELSQKSSSRQGLCRNNSYITRDVSTPQHDVIDELSEPLVSTISTAQQAPIVSQASQHSSSKWQIRPSGEKIKQPDSRTERLPINRTERLPIKSVARRSSPQTTAKNGLVLSTMKVETEAKRQLWSAREEWHSR